MRNSKKKERDTLYLIVISLNRTESKMRIVDFVVDLTPYQSIHKPPTHFHLRSLFYLWSIRAGGVCVKTRLTSHRTPTTHTHTHTEPLPNGKLFPSPTTVDFDIKHNNFYDLLILSTSLKYRYISPILNHQFLPVRINRRIRRNLYLWQWNISRGIFQCVL